MSQPPAASKSSASASKAASGLGSGGSGSSIPSPATPSQFSSSPRPPPVGPSTRGYQSTPRNAQAGKPKHKDRRRFAAPVLDEDERIAMQTIGRRGKQADITHLMNIALPPRPAHQQQHHHRHSRFQGTTWGYHAADKARYIHANYRFIVNPGGDYRVQADDADVHLDWADVLQVVASAKTQAASCPICLGEPTAPRMAKCGHIFCLPCLIRYMHSDDGGDNTEQRRARWKKCPFCWDSVYISDTRPVRFYTGQEVDPPREAADIVLRLLRRKAGSTLAMPRESGDPVPPGEHIPWYFAAEVMDYARVMKGSEDYMVGQFDEAIRAVERLEKEDELMFGEDAEWTGRAIRMLQEAKEKVRGIGNPPAPPQKPEQQRDNGTRSSTAEGGNPPIEFRDSDDGVPEMYLVKHAHAAPTVPTASPSHPAPTGQPSLVPRTLHEMRHRQHAEHLQPTEYLFYHSPPHHYLSPLDIRILKSAFGTYASFPSSLLPRVARAGPHLPIDDDLRRRVRYLAHLPRGATVSFLECDWTDVVPARVMADFAPALERRRRRWEEKEAKEEKERTRIERAEERELAALRRGARRDLAPVFSAAAEWEDLPPLSSSAVGSSDAVTAGSSPPWPHHRRTTPGFASLASPSTSPTTERRTVWGTTAVAPTSPDLPPEPVADDGWLQGWETDILEQHHQHQHQHQRVQAARGGGGGDLVGAAAAAVEGISLGGGRKGRKGKKITLMSTATARRGA